MTADPKSRAYGAANPTLTASYSGFKNGETYLTSDVTGAPALSTSATASSPVGAYTITAAVGTLASGNYAFSFVNGTLTVTPAPLTVTATFWVLKFAAPAPTTKLWLPGDVPPLHATFVSARFSPFQPLLPV